MIDQKPKAEKKQSQIGLNGATGNAISKKATFQFEGMTVTIDPELNQFSGDEFIPEKYKEAERRLAKSVLPKPLHLLK